MKHTLHNAGDDLTASFALIPAQEGTNSTPRSIHPPGADALVLHDRYSRDR